MQMSWVRVSSLKFSRFLDILLHSHMVCCRGKFRSKSWQGVLEEAKELVASGVKELNLIAEDTNQYGVLTSPTTASACFGTPTMHLTAKNAGALRTHSAAWRRAMRLCRYG